MISWRKYVDSFSEDEVRLNTESYNIRFSYLQPDEVLLARDCSISKLSTRKASNSCAFKRLEALPFWHAAASSGAEVGVRGILRGFIRFLRKLL